MAIADIVRRAIKSPSLSWSSWDDKAENVKRWRENRQRAKRFRDDLPDLSIGLHEFSNSLEKMAEISAVRGVRIMFVAQPVLWHEGLSEDLQKWLWFGGVGADFKNHKDAEYYSVSALAQAALQYKNEWRRTCQYLKLDCFDLDVQLPKDLSVFYDDVHFNESGARKVAEILSEQVGSLLK